MPPREGGKKAWLNKALLESRVESNRFGMAVTVASWAKVGENV
jgi:hypothetical protein